jgi:hypothetical protein
LELAVELTGVEGPLRDATETPEKLAAIVQLLTT